jgi:hypothetical protein
MVNPRSKEQAVAGGILVSQEEGRQPVDARNRYGKAMPAPLSFAVEEAKEPSDGP